MMYFLCVYPCAQGPSLRSRVQVFQRLRWRSTTTSTTRARAAYSRARVDALGVFALAETHRTNHAHARRSVYDDDDDDDDGVPAAGARGAHRGAPLGAAPWRPARCAVHARDGVRDYGFGRGRG